jgi:hypothetical protein
MTVLGHTGLVHSFPVVRNDHKELVRKPYDSQHPAFEDWLTGCSPPPSDAIAQGRAFPLSASSSASKMVTLPACESLPAVRGSTSKRLRYSCSASGANPKREVSLMATVWVEFQIAGTIHYPNGPVSKLGIDLISIQLRAYASASTIGTRRSPPITATLQPPISDPRT